MEHKDMLLDPDEDKEKAYEQIHALYRQGSLLRYRSMRVASLR